MIFWHFSLRAPKIKTSGISVFSFACSLLYLIELVSQVESLTRKTQLQEDELERTTMQLKEAVAIAGEETAKCKAAKEVIKSLTAQVRLISSSLE